MHEHKPSSSPRMRELDHRYRDEGGAKGRFYRLYNEGKTYPEIACEFGMNPHTLRTYWVRKWNREEAQ